VGDDGEVSEEAGVHRRLSKQMGCGRAGDPP